MLATAEVRRLFKQAIMKNFQATRQAGTVVIPTRESVNPNEQMSRRAKRAVLILTIPLKN